jgi:CHAD domain-containing protein
MNPDKIKRLLTKQSSQLETALYEVRKKKSMESVHRFRVIYKKTRTLIRISKALSGRDSCKMPGPLRKLYHQSGLVRDTGLQLMRINKDSRKLKLADQANFSSLSQKRKQAWTDFLKRFDETAITKNIQAMVSCASQQPVKQSINRWMQVRKYAVQKTVSSGSMRNMGLHVVRKELKDLYYATLYCKDWKQKAGRLFGWKIKDNTIPARLLQDLGDYQDLVLLCGLLHKRNFALFSVNEKKRLRLLSINWQAEKKALRNTIMQELKMIFP